MLFFSSTWVAKWANTACLVSFNSAHANADPLRAPQPVFALLAGIGLPSWTVAVAHAGACLVSQISDASEL